MASATLEKAVEVVADKTTPAEAAKSESRAQVGGSARTGEARAWNSRAQVD